MKLFVTGTDTNVGKTVVTTALLAGFNKLGLSTVGIKPIASGCFYANSNLHNEDAISLQQAASIKLPYEIINPFAFKPAIAPHIAAQQAQINLNITTLENKCAYALNYPADIVIVEGVGGWLVPLNRFETMADFVIKMQFEIILVVGIRLGCLNHALLTYSALNLHKELLVGWIANCLEPNMLVQHDNINFIRNSLDIPCLGVIPYHGSAEKFLDFDYLLSLCKKN